MYSVVLVDDEPLIRTGLASLIDWEGLNCTVVFQGADGEETLAWLQDHSADILICDIRMPGMDGLELAKRLYEKENPVKIIFLTAFSEFDYAQKAIRYHAVDYIVKSNYIEKLPATIQKTVELLEREHMEQEKIQNLRQCVQGQKGERQLQLLHAILHWGAGDKAQIASAAEACELSFPYYFLLCFTLRGQTFKSPISCESAMASLRNFVQIAYQESLCYPLILDKLDLAILVAPKSGSTGLRKEYLVEQAKTVIKIMDEAMGLRLNAGVSSRQTNLVELPDIKDSVFHEMDDAVFYQMSAVSVSAENRQKPKNMPEHLSTMLRQHLAEFPSERSVVQLSELLEACRAERIPATEVREMAIDIVSAYQRKVAQTSSIGDSPQRQQTSYVELNYSTTVSELYELLVQAVKSFSAIIDHWDQNYSFLVGKVLQYIQSHFRENINLSTVADAFHVNKSYLGNLYKRETGESMIDTINRRKMEMAAMLLREQPSMRVFEIAQSVGIEDPAYFSNMFTRYMGQSPKSYRNAL